MRIVKPYSEIEIETDRLILRGWTLDDVEAAFEIYGDEEVARFIGGYVVPDLDTQHTVLARMIRRNTLIGGGYGSFAIVPRDTGVPVGSALLKPIPNSEDWDAWKEWDPIKNPDEPHPPIHDVEVGWHLGRKAWGQGYATEAARAALNYGFDQLGDTEYKCVIEAENSRSHAVARRLDLIPSGTTTRYYARELDLYIARPPSSGTVA